MLFPVSGYHDKASTNIYGQVYVYIFSLLLGNFLDVRLLGHMTKVVVPFCIPTAMCESSSSPHSCPHLELSVCLSI